MPTAIPALLEPPAIPGAPSETHRFLAENVKFESISLQQRVNKLSLPEEAIAREEAAVALTSRS
jgi:hypothetical protein